MRKIPIMAMYAALALLALPALAYIPPDLQGAKAVYTFASTEKGGGLASVDATGTRDMEAQSPNPLWWSVTLNDGRKITNTDLPCLVSDQSDGPTFIWIGDIKVTVKVRSGAGSLLRWFGPHFETIVGGNTAGDSLLRARIRVDTVKPGIGLKDVVFPIVSGIKPLTKDSAGDSLVYAFRTGFTRPSPLTTGKPITMRYCIEYYMQFTALTGGGRGFYLGEHDPTAAWKDFALTPSDDVKTLGYSVSHPVTNFGAPKPPTHYESPGDIVLGPFAGDWYDAARTYRKWAITAPWCKKGPMVKRKDYPKWFLNLDYWTVGHISDAEGIAREFTKRKEFDFPNTITHDYGYYAQPYQHDLDPEYFPVRVGSTVFRKTLKDLRAKGARDIPYVMGWMWNAASEDYQRRNAKQNAAMLADDGKSVLYAELSPGEENVAMCPASKLWRDKLTEVSIEFVKRYRTGGVYLDYFTAHMNDCFNPTHGHALGGGSYWASGINGLFKHLRQNVQKIDPEATFTSEDLAEFAIDGVDAGYQGSYYSNEPLWQVVYHDYTQMFGGMHWQQDGPLQLGRQWLYGHMNQLSGAIGYPQSDPNYLKWYGNLIRCTHDFARPYLGYGEMLRMPVLTGDLPETTSPGIDQPFTSRAVEGTAWKAIDGSVGLFFFNYDSQPHKFTWKVDLTEAGLGASKKLRGTRWTVEKGKMPGGLMKGGVVTQTAEIQPLGLIALKLEVAR